MFSKLVEPTVMVPLPPRMTAIISVSVELALYSVPASSLTRPKSSKLQGFSVTGFNPARFPKLSKYSVVDIGYSSLIALTRLHQELITRQNTFQLLDKI